MIERRTTSTNGGNGDIELDTKLSNHSRQSNQKYAYYEQEVLNTSLHNDDLNINPDVVYNDKSVSFERKISVTSNVVGDINNENIDVRKMLFEEIFLTGSMPSVKRFLTEQFEDYIETSDHKLLPYVAWFGIDVILRGIAQVFLCDHPVTGIFVLFGIGITSMELVGYAILGTLFGTLGAAIVGRPRLHDITAGLCGYDGALVGCACWAFLSSPHKAAIALVLSFASGIVHVACANLLNTFELPTFTFAFNITMICFLLSVSTNHATITSLSSSSTKTYSDDYTKMSINYFVDASIRGVGQFMFVDTTVGGALVIIGIAIASRIGAFAAWTGSSVACITAYYLLQVPDLANVRNGLYGYNSSGCVASLSGSVFFYSNLSNYLGGSLVGGSLAVLILTAFQSILGTLWGLPVLTFPFITTTWIIMMTRSSLFVKLDEPNPDTTEFLTASHHSHHSFEKIKV